MTRFAAITPEPAAFAKIRRFVGLNDQALQREVQVAINRTLPDVRSYIAKRIAAEVNIPQRVIRDTISVGRARGGPQAVGEVRLSVTARISLKAFGANQVGKRDPSARSRDAITGQFLAERRKNPRAGVTYRIGRKKGRELVPGAFIAEEFGGHVFVRRPGVGRTPIFKVWGISPWGVAVVNEMVPDYAAYARERLAYHLGRRARLLQLRAAGVVAQARRRS